MEYYALSNKGKEQNKNPTDFEICYYLRNCIQSKYYKVYIFSIYASSEIKRIDFIISALDTRKNNIKPKEYSY